jgi:hypothetical protein
MGALETIIQFFNVNAQNWVKKSRIILAGGTQLGPRIVVDYADCLVLFFGLFFDRPSRCPN